MRGILTLVALAACHHEPPTPAPANPAPVAPGPLLPVDVIARGQDTFAIAADGAYLWWLTRDGTLHRVAHDGSDATTFGKLSFVAPGTIAIVDGTLYGATGSLWTLAPGDRAPRELADAGAADNPVLVGDRVYFLANQEIDVVPRAGGEPVAVLATQDAGIPDALASDGTYLYWADEGDDDNDRLGTIRRMRLGGGKIEIVADDQATPVGLTIIGDRLFWTDRGGGIIVSAPLAGGPAVVEMPGQGGWQVAGDHLGVVAMTSERLFERPTGGPIAVRALAVEATDQLALADDGIYVADSKHEEIFRYPRGDTRLTVLASSDHQITSVARDGDRLDYLERGPPDRLMSVASIGGPTSMLAPLTGAPFEVIAGDGKVAIVDATGAIRVLGGATAQAGAATSAVAIDRGRLVWVEGSDVFAVPLTGGTPRALYHADLGEGWGCGRGGGRTPDPRDCLPPQGMIGRIGDDLLLGGGTLFGVVRLDAAGVATLLASDLVGAAVAGTKLVTWTSDGAVTLDGKIVVEAGEQQPIGADPDGVWVAHGGAESRVTERLPLDGGAPALRMPGLDASAVVPLDDATGFVTSEGDLLLRLAH